MNKSLYVISYDLKNPGRDYTPLYDTIKSFEWKHPLESTWLVRTDNSADQIAKQLREGGKMDDSDLLFVCKLEPNDRQGWLDRSVWEWIRESINEQL